MKPTNYFGRYTVLSIHFLLISFQNFLPHSVLGDVPYVDVEGNAPPKSSAFESSPPEILVDDFDKWRSDSVVYYERKNSLGYYHGTWAKRPSYTLISKSETHKRGDHGKSLILTYNKTGGWCGWYTLLGGLDVSHLNTLSFWVKGQTGGERFTVGFIDEKRKQFEIDAVYAGPVQRFLEREVTTQWQEVKIPLSRVATEIDLTNLSAVVFWFQYQGGGTIYVDDMIFKSDPTVAEFEEANLPRASVDLEHPRNLWIWKTDPVTNPRATDDILKLCQDTSVERIYLYLGDFDGDQGSEYKNNLKMFLSGCKQYGITVNALNGHPTWVLADYHDKVIDWLRAILNYNDGVPLEQRIGGVVLDIEPYLIEDWNIDRDRLKEEYLTLLKRCRSLINTYPDQDLTFSTIIPIFYHKEGDFVSEILKLTDYASLMDYFDSADAIISHSKYYLDLANRFGKKIWIAIEVQDLVSMRQGTKRNTFFEEGWRFMEDELRKVRDVYHDHSSFGGFEIHCYYAYRHLQREMSTPHNRLRLEKPKDEVYRINTYHTATPVVVDGKLNEWEPYPRLLLSAKQNVVYGQHTWNGPKDLSLSVYSTWDENTLYFAFDVEDDHHVVRDSGKEMWRADHIELWLDLDLGLDFTVSVNTEDDFQLGITPGNFADIRPEVFVWTPKSNNFDYQEVDVASSKTEIGYTIEVGLPVSVLYNDNTLPLSVTDVVYSTSMHTGKEVWYTQKKAGQPPSQFFQGYRMGISIEGSDTDSSETPQKCLISSSLDRIWGDPTTFGFLEFRGPVEPEQDSDDSVTVSEEVGSQVDIKKTSQRKSPKTGSIDGVRTAGVDGETVVETFSTPEEFVTTLVKLKDVPEFSHPEKLTGREAGFAYRGRTSSYQLWYSKARTENDEKAYFDSKNDTIANEPNFTITNSDTKSIKVEYRRKSLKGFCGSYLIINGDLSEFRTLTFLIKGEKGGETFEIGMHDIISNRRQDAVFSGSIYRYLPQGITTEWQLVKIPLADFYGPDIENIFALVFRYNEIGNGTFWVDELRFSEYDLVNREKMIKEQGYLLLDNFDHSDLNLLGRKMSTYKKLPSNCMGERVEHPHYGPGGRSLRLTYKRGHSGWCGFYSLLNQIDGDYYDLSKYQSVSFMVKGEKGGENFELGMADKNWVVIGDALKAGPITKYLAGGVTEDWQKVTVPLKDFGRLDFSTMGAFAITFHKREEGVIYIDDITFHLK